MGIWQQTLEALRLQMTRATYDTWLNDTKLLSHADGIASIGVKNAYAKDWLENRLLSTIQRTLSRITGAPTNVQFTILHPPATTVADAPGPSLPSRSLGEIDPEPADRDMPADCRFGIELVSFDPTTKGFVMTSNYAIQFWQPYLATVERKQGARSGGVAFPLWQLLRSFPAAWTGRTNPFWPAIQTMADIVANGNRHRILGRAERKGRKRMVGALEILEIERIVWPRAYGEGRETIYYFRVLDTLPLLTPWQVTQLPPPIQERHQRTLSRCSIDYQEWKQLTLPSLLPKD